MRLILFICLAGLVPTSIADSLIVADAWARATPPGAGTAAVYGKLSNLGEKALTVSEMRTSVANKVHLHSTASEDGMMKMRRLDDLVIAPGETIELAPGGMHVMLMGLSTPVEQGASFPLTVITAAGVETTVDVRVGGFGQMEAPQ